MTELQEHILKIFKSVSDICEKHRIPYFAIGGTMIGAARHKGFIPWDDDIDIAVPIEYYEQLQVFLRNELPDNLRVYTCDEIEHYGCVFMKVEDESTTFIEDVSREYIDTYKGVFIDIMPISGFPTSKVQARFFSIMIRAMEKLNAYRRYPVSKAKGVLLRIFSRVLHAAVPFSFFSDCWLGLLKKCPLSTSEVTGYVWCSWVKRWTFPTVDFLDTIFMDFEDTKIRCPKGWHNYLTIQFGDYMKLPPKDQRVGGHDGIVDLNKSYHYYVEQGIGEVTK